MKRVVIAVVVIALIAIISYILVSSNNEGTSSSAVEVNVADAEAGWSGDKSPSSAEPLTNISNGLPPLPASATPPAGAIIGKGLSQFKWVDVKVNPAGAAPEVPNITQVAPGVTKHFVRVGPTWHDANLRAGRQDHKGRAEMTSLGGDTPWKLGETWIIGATTMFPKDFQIKSQFCQISQIPLHVGYFNMYKTTGDSVSGGVYVFSKGLGSPSRLIRSVTVKKGEWFSWTLRMKFAVDGRYECSINGDEFRGVAQDMSIGHIRNASVGKVQSFGGSWGLYIGDAQSGPPREIAVYHANPFMKKL